MTECNETIIVMDIVPTKKTNYMAKKTNTIAKNVTSTTSINCYSKKIRDCYILHKVLLVVIILLIILVICYYHAKQKGIIQNEK